MPKPALRPRWHRILLGACLVGTSLSPALAQDRDWHDDAPEWRDDYQDGGVHNGGRMGDMAHELRDPMNQAKVAATLSALSGALLSMDISPLTRAMDSVDGGRRARDVPRDTTVGDLAGPRARDLPYDIARKTPQAMGQMAGMAGAVDDMRPQLKSITRQLRDTLRRQGLGD